MDEASSTLQSPQTLLARLAQPPVRWQVTRWLWQVLLVAGTCFQDIWWPHTRAPSPPFGSHVWNLCASLWCASWWLPHPAGSRRWLLRRSRGTPASSLLGCWLPWLGHLAQSKWSVCPPHRPQKPRKYTKCELCKHNPSTCRNTSASSQFLSTAFQKR